MANLNNQNIGLNYKGVLNLKTLNGDLVNNSGDHMSDGVGNEVPMKLSTTGVLFDGIMGFDKAGILGVFDYSALASTTKTFTLPNLSGTFTFGTGTTNELTYWANANTISSLSTSTYPNLTELSYIKGLTSSVQNQLNSKIGLSALSANAPLSYNNSTGVFSISQSGLSTNGYLSSTDWNTFNNKQNALGFTPVPNTRTITINGVTYDLSANRSWTVSGGGGGVTSVSASSPLVSSGGATPNISIPQSSFSSDGYLSLSDWATFNAKADVNPTNGKIPTNISGAYADSIIQSTDDLGNNTYGVFDDSTKIVELGAGTSSIQIDGVNDDITLSSGNSVKVNGALYVNDYLGNPLLRFGSNTAADAALKANSNVLEAKLADDSNYAGFKARTVETVNDLTVGTSVNVGSNFVFTAKSVISSAVDGIVTLFNNALSGFTQLNFGGVTSSFPALKRNSAQLQVRLADDSADANLTAKDLTASGTVSSSGAFIATAKSIIESLTNGNFTLYNQTKTDFALLQFGGVTSAFPALRRSSAELQVVPANNPGTYSDFRVKTLALDGGNGIRVDNGNFFVAIGNVTNTFLNGNLAGVAIGKGTTTAVASAQLEVQSTTRGFLPPRMTAAQRTAIASPAVGLIVYQTDAIEGLYINKSTGWTFII